jgi:dihydrofolate synthase/folylpolyglutamate synthase
MAARFANYQAALRFLFDQTDYERMKKVSYNRTTFNLDRARWLMELVGNPQRHLPTVHIAGTKGKGSTAAMLAAMLAGCGLRVGLYSSPHLQDIRERIQVAGRMIPRRDLTRWVERIADVIETMRPVNLPTFFEIFTAIAWLQFRAARVDVAVVETGLGGRLDSTSVCEPAVCLISRISYDHTRQLGETLEQIAAEKAGIFKPAVPVVAGPQALEVSRTLRRCARRVGCPLAILGEDIPVAVRPVQHGRRLGWRVALTDRPSAFADVPVPLLGRHQADNCALALAATNRLAAAGWRLPPNRLLGGLARTRWPGRLEVVARNPTVVLDGAHNGESLATALTAVRQHFAYRRLWICFAAGADKRVDDMLAVLAAAGDARVIFTVADNPRAEKAANLAQRFRQDHRRTARTARNSRAALASAKRQADPDDLILVTGSLYLVGEARTILRRRR